MKGFIGTTVRREARLLACILVAGGLFGAAPAGALPFTQLFFFGDSLSDSGNVAIALGPGVRTPTPIPGNTFIPSAPYTPSDRFSDGPVWTERLGLPALPSLAGGTNFAFGGAKTGPTGLTPPSLRDQVATFLTATGGVAPSDALYVVAGGGNNARDALEAIGGGGNPAAIIPTTALGYAADVGIMVGALKAAGADDIIVWNTPDVGLAPAVLANGPAASFLGTTLATAMNTALLGAIGAIPGVEIFHIFDLVQDIVASPGSFGLTNVTDACAQFVPCVPSTFLFWDGIHVTSAGHQIIAGAVLALIPEPGTLLLVLAGLTAVLGAHARARPCSARRTS